MERQYPSLRGHQALVLLESEALEVSHHLRIGPRDVVPLPGVAVEVVQLQHRGLRSLILTIAPVEHQRLTPDQLEILVSDTNLI